MGRPWYTITSIESHKTSGGAWTRIPYIGRASVDRVVWWSPMSMWTGKERKWSHPKPACINMSWGLCALSPHQPRCLAIFSKRSITERTWQAANVSGLMHYGETEGLKQRCVHRNTFTHRSFYTQTLLRTETFTHRRFYTQALLHTDAFTHRHICTQALLHTDAFTHRRFYTQTLWHTDAFTHRRFYTQTLLHTDAFTHKHFYTQKLLHTGAFTHRDFYTQTFLHTGAFTHRRFYTQTLLHTDTFAHSTFTHRRFYTQTLLHTNTLTHRRFYTQTLLHTNTFTHRRFYTQRLLRTNTFTRRRFYTQTCDFTHRRFYTQTLLHTDAFTHKHSEDTLKSQFYLSFWRSNLISCERVAIGPWKSQFFTSFWRSNLISCERLAIGPWKSQFYLSFWRSNLISCERVARDDLIAILPQFLTIEPHFVRKGCRGHLEIAILPSVFDDRTSFRAKGLRGTTWNRNFTLSFWRSNLISFERVAADTLKSQFYPQFLTIEPHFVRKGCAGRLEIAILPSVFDDRTSFRAKGLRFVASRCHCPGSRLKRER